MIVDDAIENFTKKVKTANDFNSKEVRISTAEATTLSLSIIGLLAQNLALSTKIVELQEKLLANQTSFPTTIDFNGGRF
jgi:hypothetical protein